MGDTAIQLNATEGIPLSLELFGHDSDIDLIDWNATTLPRGMSLALPASDDTTRVVLNWTPDRFAAQDGNTGTPGLWRFTVTGSDGTAQFTRSFEITVANVNQTPRILPIPLQLVNEGETLSFTLRAADADNGDRASTSANLSVTVLPVNDAPLAANASYAVAQGGSIRIDFASLVSDVDGNILTLTLSKPRHGRLLKNADGSYTYTPKRGYRGTESFGYTVSDGTLSTTASITVAVSGKRDDDNSHHGGHCARLVVQSGYGNGKDRDEGQGSRFVAVSTATRAAPAIKVDWQSSAPNRDKAVDDGWVKDYFVKRAEPKSLAELTGLVVRLVK